MICVLGCYIFVFFFFQAEDGIRDRDVTGVQTCALPISFCMVMGAQNELGIGSVPLNPGGAIPTTVYAVRFRMILLPTSDAWLANVPRHKSSLITTTAFPPGAAQSDASNPRPCPACSPRTSTDLHVA